MAAYTKFNVFAGDLAGKVHDLLGTAGSTADTLKIYLSNTSPNVSTNLVKSDLAEIVEQNGYTAPVSTANVGANSAGTVTVTGTNVTVTASGGSVGPFRYIVLYNATAGTTPLVAYWDYGSGLTLNDGDSFVVKFNNGASSGTLFTLA